MTETDFLIRLMGRDSYVLSTLRTKILSKLGKRVKVKKEELHIDEYHCIVQEHKQYTVNSA